MKTNSRPILSRSLLTLAFAGLIVSLLLMGTTARADAEGSVAFTKETVAATLGNNCTEGTIQNIPLDGVDLQICLPFRPEHASSADPQDWVQAGSWITLSPHQSFGIYAVPYGIYPSGDRMPMASLGTAPAYRSYTRNIYKPDAFAIMEGPSIMIFGSLVQGTAYWLPDENGDSSEDQQLITEWIAEAGDRVWIIRSIIFGTFSDRAASTAALEPLQMIYLASPSLQNPSTSYQLHKKPTPRQSTPSEVGPLSVGVPGWWDGDCDKNRYYQITGTYSYRLGAVWDGLIACGPGGTANYPNGIQTTFGGAGGTAQLEFQCAELPKRYLFQRYGLAPRSANGVDVVNVYDGALSNLRKVTNGTANGGLAAGDIISYNGPGSAGHTAVVTSVTWSDGNGNGTYTTIEQNSSASGARTNTITNWFLNSNSGISVYLHDSNSGGNSCSSTISMPSGYTKCADEDGTCTFNGTADVVFGANDKFIKKTGVTGSISCSNSAFSCDPINGIRKACYYKITSQPPSGNWHVEYFNDRNLGGRCSESWENSTYLFKNWGNGAPAGGCNSDNFSARFTSSFNFPGGYYSFHCQHDDGCRIFIDGQEKLGAWWDSSFTGHDWGGNLSGNHEVRVEFYDGGGDARLEAFWSGSGFLPTGPSCNASDWCGSYYGNRDFAGTAAMNINEGSGTINKDWGNNSPGYSFPSDNFSVRWQRDVYFDPGLYRFHIRVDDGGRLFVGNSKVIDAWKDQGATEYTVDINLDAGTTHLSFEYYDNGGGAVAQAWWELLQPACFLLTRDYSGSGSMPTANPASSTGCSTGYYHGGELITLTAHPATGSHLDHWTGTDGAANNNLTMPASAWTVGAHYALDVTGDSYEPDNSSASAKWIYPGSAQSHSILPAGDQDWVKFELGAVSAVTLETTGPVGHDTFIRLYDGNLVEVESDDDDGTGNYSLINRVCGTSALPAGTYQLKVVEFYGTNTIPDYQIHLAVSPCPTTTIQVRVAGSLQGSYDLPPFSTARPSYPGLNNGPVKIESTNGLPIVASERVAYSPDGGTTWTSYSELMGMPSSQLTTSYVMPWYNNAELNTQLRFGNAGTAPTIVTVTVGGVVRGNYYLAASQSLRVAYPGLNSGPVRITSSGGVPIIASMRVAYFDGSNWTDFSELMGLPTSRLTTSYTLPWYNNAELNTQLRFGNVGNAATNVTVKVAGVVRGTYYLAPSQAVRVAYPGLNSGPIVITSSGGVPIIASERVAYFDGSNWTNFSELMALPTNQLTTTYWMPVYNNVGLNTQLRFGNVGTAGTTVTVTVGGIVKGSYFLAPSQAVRIAYTGLDGGPVKISSSGGVPIIASMRVAYFDGSNWPSFSEMMGLPASQLSTSYVMPWYNNLELDTQLRFAVP